MIQMINNNNKKQNNMKREELVLASQAKQDNKIAISKAISKEKKAFEKELRNREDKLDELKEKLNDRLDSEITLEYAIIESELMNIGTLEVRIKAMKEFITVNYDN